MNGLFTYPVWVPHNLQWVLILPLLLGVAIVYKTIRTRTLSRLWLEALISLTYMVVGLALLGAVLWVWTTYWP